ncbi:MAG: DUF3303 family protein [Nitrospirales bacterium]
MKPLIQFAVEWSDLMKQQITPMIEDRELAEVLTAAGK